jgi:DNA-binding transcriptional regulator LsrR (DeoR family)
MDESHHEQLAQIASKYYEQGMTQSAIATELGLSRVKVYRLLKEAKAEQVVQITINWPIERDNQLEGALKSRFALKDALVLRTSPQDPSPALQRLGQLGARYLEQVLKDGTTMAVCLGRSTYEVINAVRPGFQAQVRVAQAIGSMPFAMQELDSAALARQLAQQLGGDVLYLSSPVMADSPEAAEVLRSQQGIESTLNAARTADVALVGIGNLDPATSGFVRAGFITPQELTQLTADGAVGDVAGQIFTLSGELHPCEYNHRVIGITFDELCRIPTTIAVAMGQEKAKAILGCLRTCIINVLCTDDQVASEVLGLDRGWTKG